MACEISRAPSHISCWFYGLLTVGGAVYTHKVRDDGMDWHDHGMGCHGHGMP